MRIMKRFLLTLNIILLAALVARAQYTTCGKIEYERKTNVHAMMKDYESDDENDSWYERIKSSTPQPKNQFQIGQHRHFLKSFKHAAMRWVLTINAIEIAKYRQRQG